MLLSSVVALIVIAYSISSTWINGFIMRLPCVSTANFSIRIQNFALSGSIIASLTVSDVQECQMECLFNEHCISINFAEKTDCCELNGGSDHGNSMLIERIGWAFIATNDSVNVGRPCHGLNLNNEDAFCPDICYCPGYPCKDCSSEAYEAKSSLFISWPDCASIRKVGTLSSGVYRLRLHSDSEKVTPVFCDLETNGYNWFVFQRRIDDSTTFDRRWSEYKNGFGNPLTNYWLGLDGLQLLTNRKRQAMLRIILKFINEPSVNRIADYSFFRVGDEMSGYMLSLGGYSSASTLPDSMTPSSMGGYLSLSGMKFSTPDRDNDVKEDANCGENLKGGWWFKSCYHAYLNGLYHNPSHEIDCMDEKASQSYMTWRGSNFCFGGITFSEMKIRYIERH